MSQARAATAAAGRRGALLAIGLLACAAGAPARAETPDPNLAAVQAVCGRCHGLATFMGEPRSWPRWNDVFRQMSRLGASGTPEQLEQVTAYFLDHLATVNVNTGAPEELAWVLDVGDDVVAEILRRRAERPFRTLTELAAVPGVRPARLARLKDRIAF